MKPFAWCAAVVVLACGIAKAEDREVPWDAQLAEFGYHILCTSSINLINGLQLTVDQATRLKALAADVEKVSLKAPPNTGTFNARWQPARETFRDLEEILIKGEEVPSEMEARLRSGRAAEAAVIKASLAHDPSKQGCAKCHADVSALKPGAQTLDGSEFNEKEKGAAHVTGPYGKSGIVKVFLVANEIEKILTPAQLSLLGDFTCCITPPKNLKDPARVGQAAVSENRLDLLRNIRKIPESTWPISRKVILKRTEDGLAAAHPGISESEKQADVEKAGKLLDKARSLSDVDFELQKEELAKDFSPRAAKAQAAAGSTVKPSQHAAWFLMLPGSTRVYDALLERLQRAPAVAAGQVNLKTIKGAENCQDGNCALKGAGNLKPAK